MSFPNYEYEVVVVNPGGFVTAVLRRHTLFSEAMHTKANYERSASPGWTAAIRAYPQNEAAKH